MWCTVRVEHALESSFVVGVNPARSLVNAFFTLMHRLPRSVKVTFATVVWAVTPNILVRVLFNAQISLQFPAVYARAPSDKTTYTHKRIYKVGWIFAHPPREEGFLFSAAEVITAATLQLEAAEGINDTPFVTVKVRANTSK